MDALLAGMVVGVGLLAVGIYDSWVAFPITMAVGGAGSVVFVLFLVLVGSLEGFSNDVEQWLNSFLGFIVAAALLVGVLVGLSLLAVWLFGSWRAFPITMGVGSAVFALLLVLGVFVFSDDGEELVGLVLTFVLALVVVAAGCWVLWLLTLGQGQTPGKAALGIKAVDVATAEKVSWGRMFLRELAAKWLCAGLLATLFLDGSFVPWLRVALIALWIVSVLWPLWDKNKQALHDKVVGTTIVHEKEDSPKS